ncbi:hypothetical protein BSKO_12416 [Bryopsis sp. KO-2023]|nr:hypothetical protein BSKO_12416 [Bryopsis sp. KO-2023]
MLIQSPPACNMRKRNLWVLFVLVFIGGSAHAHGKPGEGTDRLGSEMHRKLQGIALFKGIGEAPPDTPANADTTPEATPSDQTNGVDTPPPPPPPPPPEPVSAIAPGKPIDSITPAPEGGIPDTEIEPIITLVVELQFDALDSDSIASDEGAREALTSGIVESISSAARIGTKDVRVVDVRDNSTIWRVEIDLFDDSIDPAALAATLEDNPGDVFTNSSFLRAFGVPDGTVVEATIPLLFSGENLDTPTDETQSMIDTVDIDLSDTDAELSLVPEPDEERLDDMDLPGEFDFPPPAVETGSVEPSAEPDVEIDLAIDDAESGVVPQPDLEIGLDDGFPEPDVDQTSQPAQEGDLDPELESMVPEPEPEIDLEDEIDPFIPEPEVEFTLESQVDAEVPEPEFEIAVDDGLEGFFPEPESEIDLDGELDGIAPEPESDFTLDGQLDAITPEPESEIDLDEDLDGAAPEPDSDVNLDDEFDAVAPEPESEIDLDQELGVIVPEPESDIDFDGDLDDVAPEPESETDFDGELDDVALEPESEASLDNEFDAVAPEPESEIDFDGDLNGVAPEPESETSLDDEFDGPGPESEIDLDQELGVIVPEPESDIDFDGDLDGVSPKPESEIDFDGELDDVALEPESEASLDNEFDAVAPEPESEIDFDGDLNGVAPEPESETSLDDEFDGPGPESEIDLDQGLDVVVLEPESEIDLDGDLDDVAPEPESEINFDGILDGIAPEPESEIDFDGILDSVVPEPESEIDLDELSAVTPEIESEIDLDDDLDGVAPEPESDIDFDGDLDDVAPEPESEINLDGDLDGVAPEPESEINLDGDLDGVAPESDVEINVDMDVLAPEPDPDMLLDVDIMAPNPDFDLSMNIVPQEEEENVDGLDVFDQDISGVGLFSPEPDMESTRRKVKVVVRLPDQDFESVDDEQKERIKAEARQEIADAAGVDVDDVKILEVRPGSIIVEAEVTLPPDGAESAKSEDRLQSLAEDPGSVVSPEFQDRFGAVEVTLPGVAAGSQPEDETEVIPIAFDEIEDVDVPGAELPGFTPLSEDPLAQVADEDGDMEEIATQQEPVPTEEPAMEFPKPEIQGLSEFQPAPETEFEIIDDLPDIDTPLAEDLSSDLDISPIEELVPDSEGAGFDDLPDIVIPVPEDLADDLLFDLDTPPVEELTPETEGEGFDDLPDITTPMAEDLLSDLDTPPIGDLIPVTEEEGFGLDVDVDPEGIDKVPAGLPPQAPADAEISGTVEFELRFRDADFGDFVGSNNARDELETFIKSSISKYAGIQPEDVTMDSIRPGSIIVKATASLREGQDVNQIIDTIVERPDEVFKGSRFGIPEVQTSGGSLLILSGGDVTASTGGVLFVPPPPEIEAVQPPVQAAVPAMEPEIAPLGSEPDDEITGQETVPDFETLSSVEEIVVPGVELMVPEPDVELGEGFSAQEIDILKEPRAEEIDETLIEGLAKAPDAGAVDSDSPSFMNNETDIRANSADHQGFVLVNLLTVGVSLLICRMMA